MLSLINQATRIGSGLSCCSRHPVRKPPHRGHTGLGSCPESCRLMASANPSLQMDPQRSHDLILGGLMVHDPQLNEGSGYPRIGTCGGAVSSASMILLTSSTAEDATNGL